MASTVKGFPKKFPVRDDDRRPLRYCIASLAGRVYLRLFSRHRLRIEGEDNIPGDGPLLVACNHISNLDPIVFGGYFPRTLFVMAKQEMYVNRPVACVAPLLEVEAVGEDQGLGDVLRAVTGHALLRQPRAEQAELLAVVADGGWLLLVGAALDDEELDGVARALPVGAVRQGRGGQRSHFDCGHDGSSTRSACRGCRWQGPVKACCFHRFPLDSRCAPGQLPQHSR